MWLFPPSSLIIQIIQLIHPSICPIPAPFHLPRKHPLFAFATIGLVRRRADGQTGARRPSNGTRRKTLEAVLGNCCWDKSNYRPLLLALPKRWSGLLVFLKTGCPGSRQRQVFKRRQALLARQLVYHHHSCCCSNLTWQ